MTVSPFRENRYQWLLRTYIYPVVRDYPVFAFFGLWVIVSLAFIGHFQVYSGYTVLWYLLLALWATTFAGLLYSIRCHKRFDKYLEDLIEELINQADV